MKKFISMVMAASMVASLVPATAFAAKADEITGTARVVDAWDKNRDFNGVVTGSLVPEAQVRINNVDYLRTDTGNPPKARFTVRLDNAKFSEDFQKNPDNYVKFTSGSRGEAANPGTTTYTYTEQDAAGLEAMLTELWDNELEFEADPSGYVWFADGQALPASGAEATRAASQIEDVTAADIFAAAKYNVTKPVVGNSAEKNANNALTQYLVANGMGTAGWTLSGKVDGTDSSAKWTNKAGDVVTLADVLDWIENGTDGSFASADAAGTQYKDATVGDLTGATAAAGVVDKIKKLGTITVAGVSVDLSKITALDDGTAKPADIFKEIQGLVNEAFAKANSAAIKDNATYVLLSNPVVASVASSGFTIDCTKTTMTWTAGKPGPGTAEGLNDAGTGFVASGADDKDTWLAAAKTQLNTVLGSGQAKHGKIYKETSKTTGQLPATGISRDIKVEVEKKASSRVVAGSQIERDDEVTVVVTGWLEKDDVISVDLDTKLKTTSKTAYFSIDSDDIKLSNDSADIAYVLVEQEGLKLSIRKLVDVAEEEVVTLDDRGLVIKTNVGEFKAGDIVLKLSKGFEFADDYKFIGNADRGEDWRIVTKNVGETVGPNATVVAGDDDDELIVRVASDDTIDEIIIYGIDIEATSAKSGATATIRATSKGFTAAAAVEVAKVVDYKVILERDEDEDLPVIYSGVDTDNYGITDDSDHWSVEITAKETFPGAWSFRKGFNFEMTEGVYVTDIDVVEVDGFLKSKTDAVTSATPVTAEEVGEAFFNAYQNGSHVNFEFDKRVFDDVDAKLNEDKATMTFKLQLVADPGFEGDAVVKLTGELVDEQELTVAKFVKPYEVKAEQNDMIIDYRYTEVPTAITITEAEAGLWDSEKATFRFSIEKENLMSFEDDPTFEIDSKSDLELKNAKVKDGKITFTVKSESDEAATVTIKDIQLFMNRSIPAGPYDLSIGSSLADAYENEVLFAPDGIKGWVDRGDDNRYGINRGDYTANNRPTTGASKEDAFVGDVADYSDTVKEAFINVVTAGRDKDDASFTTKVVVPVGENYIVAGEKQVELDTPAYINAAGYTMLPIRAVAVALGINSNNVLWDQPTKTVTILYGQRIITMTQGQKVVYVNGSAIPASAAVENTNSRTFLPMRDLATALGVTDITWDQATRTATLNGNQK